MIAVIIYNSSVTTDNIFFIVDLPVPLTIFLITTRTSKPLPASA